MPIPLLGEIGESDCERLADAFLHQPVNAVSSLAYVVVALVVVALPWRRRLDAAAVVYAACLAAVGFGSVAFHGPQPAGSRLAHDLPIVLTLLLMVLAGVQLLRPSVRWPLPFVVGGAAATVVSWLAADAAGVLSGLLVVALVIVETLVFRGGRRVSSRRHQIRAYVAMAGVLAVAGPLWILGRTDSPLCDPDSLVQPHGMWHVASAVVFGLWWWLAIAPSADG